VKFYASKKTLSPSPKNQNSPAILRTEVPNYIVRLALRNDWVLVGFKDFKDEVPAF
jgi:hypothetical protein